MKSLIVAAALALGVTMSGAAMAPADASGIVVHIGTGGHHYYRHHHRGHWVRRCHWWHHHRSCHTEWVRW